MKRALQAEICKNKEILVAKSRNEKYGSLSLRWRDATEKKLE